jgi:hypothetical protein
MAFLGDEPKNELIIERVPGGRRAALVAAVVAALIVGTLVWKPWDTGAPAASPRLTLPVAALATASVIPPTSEPSSANEPSAATPEPIVKDNGLQVIAAPNNLGSVEFYPDEGPAGWCIYKSADEKARPTLSVILVQPPVVTVSQSAGGSLQSVRWHIELERNTQDKIFNAEWIHARDSRVTAMDVNQYGFVIPISIAVPAASSITVFRAPMIIDWLGKQATVLATQQVLPATYGVLGAPDSAIQPGGCPETM